MWIWILLLATISIYNTVYGFLPDRLQSNWWVRLPAIIVAALLLLHGVNELIQGYRNSRYAYVSPEGKIMKSRHFPWAVTRVTDASDGFPVYCIRERYGDASEVHVVPDREVNRTVFNAIDGVAIKFLCKPEGVPSFKIKIGP
jgi:hypothetical protein